jgi:hypothetical protein
MKPRKNHLLPATILLLASLSYSQADILYYDNFDGLATAGLAGTTPDTTMGTNTWSSSGVFFADGHITSNTRMAALPFVPAAGHIYKLSAELNPTADSANWLGLGFTNSYGLSAITSNTPSGLLIVRGDRDQTASTDFAQAFSTGTTLSKSYIPPAPLTGLVPVSVTLNTMQPNWVFEWYVNGIAIGSHTFTGTNPTISRVAVGTNNIAGFVDNFQLEDMPLVDSDGDGMLDYWEQKIINGNPGDGITTIAHVLPDDDFDGDNASNLAEYNAGTDPVDTDTDNDTLPDGSELNGTANTYDNSPTNPLLADSDGDSVADANEISGTFYPAFPGVKTNPNVADTDSDGFKDALEIVYATHPDNESSRPVLYELIGLTKGNGSFEYRDGAINITNFKQGWDGASGVNNIDAWSTWTEQTTTSSDSGVETGNATHGSMKGFCQSGNGAKNMSNYKAKEGDILRLTYDRVNGYTTGNTYLVYDGTDLGAGFVQIPTSPAQTLTGNGSYEIAFKVPAGSPAVGRSVGVGIKSTGSWPGWDRVVLTVVDSDSDGDSLSDFLEDRYWGNNDDNPTPSEIAVTTGSADFDGDGVSNAAEVAAGSNPNDINSTPTDTDADGLADEWENSNFGNLAQTGSGDPDGDFATNESEETGDSSGSTIPLAATSWPDTDGDELNDGWEKHYFSGSLAQINTGDPDGDGFDNLAEMQAGSDPTNAAWSPSVPRLAHRWSFNGNLTDSVGGSTATIENDTAGTAGGSSTLSPTSITLNGGTKAAADWVKLGANLLQGKKTPVTIELWAATNSTQNWGRVFDFHSGTTEYLMMAWTQGINANTDQVEWRDVVNTNLGNTNAPYVLGTKYHILMTIVPAFNSGGSTGATVTWYSANASGTLMGPAKGSFTTGNSLAVLNDAINGLGRSPFGDNTAGATYDEVRIWDGAASAGARQTLHVAGPDSASLVDSDSDGLYDAWETAYFGNLSQNGSGNPDGDAFNNLAEQADGSNPTVAASIPGDVDGDGLGDVWELANFGDLDETPAGDPDGDYDTNLVEFTHDTLGNSKFSFHSSTGDSVPDSWKAYFAISAATGEDDSDSDGVINVNEFYNNTFPNDADSDDDGLTEGAEVNAATNPLDADSDDDGLNDGPEVTGTANPGFGNTPTNPLSADTDGDTFLDGYEVANGSNPASPLSRPTQAAGFTKIEDFEGPGMVAGQTFNGINGWNADAQNLVVANPDGSGQSGHWLGGAMRKSLTHHARQILDGNTGTLFMQVLLPGSDNSLIDHSFSLSDTTGTGTGDNEAQTGYINGNMTVRNGGGNYTTPYTHTNAQWFNVWVVADNSSDTVKVWVESPANASGKVQINEAQVCSFRNGVAANPLIQVLFLEFDSGSIIIDNLYVDATAQNLTNPLAPTSDSDADGMDDAWETAYFGGTSAANGGPAEDYDSDGTDNLTEFRLGLIPNNGASAFTASRNTATGQLTWPSKAGATFRVERSTTLTGAWSVLESSLPAAAAPSTSTGYTDPSPQAGDRSFYRIGLNP